MTQNTNDFVEWANPLNIHQSGHCRNPNLGLATKAKIKKECESV
jgi:hypothetical protein